MKANDILIKLTNARLNGNKVLITTETPFDTNEYEFIDFSFMRLKEQYMIFNDYQSVCLYDYEINEISQKTVSPRDLEQHVKNIPLEILNARARELDSINDILKEKKEVENGK